MVWGRGTIENVRLDTLRQIKDRLYFVERFYRRGVHLDYVSDDEAEAPNPNPEPEEDQDEARLLRVLSKKNSKPTIEVISYDGKLDTNFVLD